MARKIKDALLKVAIALPAAGASSFSDWIDLGEGEPVEKMEILISGPAVENLADTKTITYLIEESPDKASIADAPWTGTLIQTGSGGAGDAASELRLRPPSNAKRYIRLQQDVEAVGGDNTGDSGSLELLF